MRRLFLRTRLRVLVWDAVIIALLVGVTSTAIASPAGGSQDARRDARRIECRTFGCRPATGDVAIAMDPTLAGGFMSMPWPADSRRRPDGTIDLAGFPGRDVSSSLDQSLAKGEVATHGFGTNSAIYMQTTAPIDPASLPTASQSVRRHASVVLLDLSNPRAAPVPLLTDFKVAPTRLRPANLITLLPYPGHPLSPGHRYAAVAFDGLRDTGGRALAPSPLLEALDGRPPAGVSASVWFRLRSERAATFRALRARTLWRARDVVAFTVFTTQRITPDLDAIAAAIRALPPPEPVERTVGDCSAGDPRIVVSGAVDLPKWQVGVPPYLLSGGEIVIGPDGRAVREGTERAQFQLALPCAKAPAHGWPILLFMDGTGGVANAGFISQLGEAPLPYVVVSIAPLYSGDRSVGVDTALAFFGVTNPVAGRTNQLQQAADMLYLERIAKDLQLSPSEGVGGVPPLIDDETVVVAGHSQGAITVPLVLAEDRSIDGGFISSGGAGLYHSLVHRADVHLLITSLLSAEPGELDIFHPDVQVLQTIAEIGDAANYARRVRSDVALYAGWIDGCSPIEANVDLAEALRVPIANPIARPVFGTSRFEPSTADLPVSANLADGRTGVTVALEQGHFGASLNPGIGRSFINSIADGRPATVDPGVLNVGFPTPGCLGRADPPPGG